MLWARSVCCIVDNHSNLVEFELNPIQVKLHNAIEEQLKRTGKVRAIILKSRKLGMSTYTAARFSHKILFNPHSRAVVITHQSDSSSILYGIYQRIYNFIPEIFKPKLTKDNSKELVFAGLMSSLKVATAGSGATGRGDTINYLHASEIALWPNAEEISSGLMRAVPNTAGTEVIIESTSQGIGDLFHRIWVGAVNGENAYLPLFFGWNEDPLLVEPTPDDFKLTEEEAEYQTAWNLSNEQIFWRRQTIKEMGDEKFRQEYPISAEEAFRNTTVDSFIMNAPVLVARKNVIPMQPKYTPLILGIDVAVSLKGDMSCVVWRRGNHIEKYQKFQLEIEQLVHKVVEILKRDNPTRVYIDGTGGFGGQLVIALQLLGYDTTSVNFSSSPINPDYFNKRAEMYAEFKEWLGNGSNVKLPDDDEVESDLTSFSYKHRNGKLLLENKGEAKKRLKRSPDVGDAIALCFSEQFGPNLMTNGANSAAWQKILDRERPYSW